MKGVCRCLQGFTKFYKLYVARISCSYVPSSIGHYIFKTTYWIFMFFPSDLCWFSWDCFCCWCSGRLLCFYMLFIRCFGEAFFVLFWCLLLIFWCSFCVFWCSFGQRFVFFCCSFGGLLVFFWRSRHSREKQKKNTKRQLT